MNLRLLVLIGSSLAGASQSVATERALTERLAECVRERDDALRLACFDRETAQLRASSSDGAFVSAEGKRRTDPGRRLWGFRQRSGAQARRNGRRRRAARSKATGCNDRRGCAPAARRVDSDAGQRPGMGAEDSDVLFPRGARRSGHDHGRGAGFLSPHDLGSLNSGNPDQIINVSPGRRRTQSSCAARVREWDSCHATCRTETAPAARAAAERRLRRRRREPDSASRRT